MLYLVLCCKYCGFHDNNGDTFRYRNRATLYVGHTRRIFLALLFIAEPVHLHIYADDVIGDVL